MKSALRNYERIGSSGEGYDNTSCGGRPEFRWNCRPLPRFADVIGSLCPVTRRRCSGTIRLELLGIQTPDWMEQFPWLRQTDLPQRGGDSETTEASSAVPQSTAWRNKSPKVFGLTASSSSAPTLTDGRTPTVTSISWW